MTNAAAVCVGVQLVFIWKFLFSLLRHTYDGMAGPYSAFSICSCCVSGAEGRDFLMSHVITCPLNCSPSSGCEAGFIVALISNSLMANDTEVICAYWPFVCLIWTNISLTPGVLVDCFIIGHESSLHM